ncbi:MAG: class I SAM-dependent methyltransferase [Bacteroidota bacterium]
MHQEYDLVTAHHYAAYRPPLHAYVLNKCLGWREKVALGLDYGCGTGHSSIALSRYCERVVGMEISEAMYARRLLHPQVSYDRIRDAQIPLPDQSVDLATFAGSLYYARSQALLDEVQRVCKKGGLILAYDFELVLDTLLQKLLPAGALPGSNGYDHQANFSGLDLGPLQFLDEGSEQTTLSISSSNLAHILLSVQSWHMALQYHIEGVSVYEMLRRKLSDIATGEDHQVNARLYYTRYGRS